MKKVLTLIAALAAASVALSAQDAQKAAADAAAALTAADDKPEVVKDRLKTYHDQTEPLKDFYAEKGKLTLTPGNAPIDSITAEICKVLDSIRG